MKIPLHVGSDAHEESRAAQSRQMESLIQGARAGDWTARNELARAFTPLISSLAKKRSNDNAKINDYIEAGRQGLFAASRKYKRSIGPDKFRLFALDFIEKSMDRLDHGGGFLSRLFGR